MRTHILLGAALAALILPGPGRAQAAGGVQISGTSTVGDWSCREAAVQLAPASPGALAAPPQPGKAACNLRLPERKAVDVHLKLGRRNPMEWVNWVG